MCRKLEIELEKKICEKVVECLLSAGYRISVNDGEDIVLKDSFDKSAIMNAVFSTDEDHLIAYKEGEGNKFVTLIWGNVESVIHDYSYSLEHIIKPALDFADSYAN
jgi:hypothetical protein